MYIKTIARKILENNTRGLFVVNVEANQTMDKFEQSAEITFNCGIGNSNLIVFSVYAL